MSGKLSFNDSKNYIKRALINNEILITIFGNALIISLIITVFIMLIIHLTSETYMSQSIYSFLLTFTIILMNNYIIKFKYKKEGSNESNIFSNTDIVKNPNVIPPRSFNKYGSNEQKEHNDNDSNLSLEPDIKKFLGMTDI